MTNAEWTRRRNAAKPRSRLLILFDRVQRRINLDLILLLLVLVGFNLPYLNDRVVPIHDTAAIFEGFHYFYSEYTFHGEIARWLPYGGFGLPAEYYQIITLSPVDYFMGFIGRLFSMTDALFVFKLAVLGEQIIFLLGMFLFARTVFKKRSTIFLVCLAAIGSTIWYAQLWFNFRFYTMFPLIAYLVLMFIQKRRPEYLWLAGISGIAWSIGNVPYFLPMWGLVFAVFFVIIAIKERDALRSLFTPSLTNILLFSVFILLAFFFIYFTTRSLNNFYLNAPGRDPVTGRVTLETFTTYGGKGVPLIVLESFLSGVFLHLPWGSGVDNSVYIGILPLVFFAWAFFKEKSRIFYGVFGSFITLLWISLGGIFTSFLYYVPLMSNYRHIGLVFGLVKVLVLIMAGFGIDAFMTSIKERKPNILLAIVSTIFLIEGLFFIPQVINNVLPGADAQNWFRFVFSTADIFFARIMIYCAGIAISLIAPVGFPKLSFERLFKPAMVFALLFDLITFQYLVFHTQLPALPAGYAGTLDSVQVREMTYQAQRQLTPIDYTDPATATPENLLKAHAIQLATRPGVLATYVDLYYFAQFDPCTPEYRSDFMTFGVNRLSFTRKINADDAGVMAVIGCKVPKLRLMSNAIVVDLEESAFSLVRDTPNLGDVAVIRLLHGVGQTGRVTDKPALAGEAAVTQFNASSISIKATVTDPDGAWLIYADAYHPAWRATVNGQPALIEEANLAFKAVHLPAGESAVRFVFWNGLSSIVSAVIAVFGILFTLLMIAVLVREMARTTDDEGPMTDDAQI